MGLLYIYKNKISERVNMVLEINEGVDEVEISVHT